MAVPVRADLLAQTLDFGKRTWPACRVLREAQPAVSGLARGLGDPLRLIEERSSGSMSAASAWRWRRARWSSAAAMRSRQRG